MTSEILIGLGSAALGFLGGLLAPWVRWVIDKRRLERTEKTALISEWRKAIEVFDFENETIGDSVWY